MAGVFFPRFVLFSVFLELLVIILLEKPTNDASAQVHEGGLLVVFIGNVAVLVLARIVVPVAFRPLHTDCTCSFLARTSRCMFCTCTFCSLCRSTGNARGTNVDRFDTFACTRPTFACLV